MLRLALAISLTAFGAACGSEEDADERPPQTVSQAAVLPAAPPASNALATAADTVEASPATAAAFRQILDAAQAEDVAERPFGEVVQWVGEQLLGRPYAAGLLDAPPQETLVVDLTAFDCVLYVENVLALARAIVLEQDDYTDYARGVESLRYRGGTMDGYCSRLHYFSDWIVDNERRGAVENVTQAVGGERFDKRISFMTANRESYPKLVSDETFACIVDMEADLRDVDLFYIPQDRISEAYDHLRHGDVIATATSIGGLDVTHTGFVHKTDAHTGFMHASLASNQVKISPDLEDYVQGIRSQVGIVVVRPLDPRQTAGS